MEWTPETEQLIDEVFESALDDCALKEGILVDELRQMLRAKHKTQVRRKGPITRTRRHIAWRLHSELCQFRQPRGILKAQRLRVSPDELDKCYQLLGAEHIAKKLGISRAGVVRSLQAHRTKAVA